MKRLGEALNGRMPGRANRPAVPPPPQADECPICKGARYLRLDAPYGSPLFGRLVDCECRLAEQRRRDFEELQLLSNLEPFRDKTFESFDSKVNGVGRAYEEALKFAKNPNGWLILTGRCGTGKTHLAAAIANKVIQEQQFQTFFTVVPDLLDHLRSTFGPSSEISYDELFEKVRSTPLIILDDLGTENATPWAREKLYQIINHRYNYGLPTVITMNRNLEEIDERIRSRMQDTSLCVLIHIQAADYRLKQPGERLRRTKSRRTV
ncbi:MAG: ATP-binding protein [Chloroflexota bacterium]